jgi:hypothetical protein
MAGFIELKRGWRVAAGVVLGLALGAVQGRAAVRPGEGPPDLTPYQRPLVDAETSRELARPLLAPGATLVDLAVAAGLGATDTMSDSETSIAIDPNDPDRITISAFSGSWGRYAPIWNSTDGGMTWSKSFTVPVPPRAPDARGCPCDQTFDYGRSAAVLFGAILGIGKHDERIWSGDSSDPSSGTFWQWLVGAGVAATASHTRFSDQPWLMVNRDPDFSTQDDVYVGFTDYAEEIPENHVAVSLGANPPDFPPHQDIVVSTSSGTGFLASAALRIAADPRDGAIYAAWQDNVSLDLANCARNVDFRLLRSTDHGRTWSLGGDPRGILVATRQSDEGQPDNPNLSPTRCRNHVEKFGTVNALLGGSVAVAVDPSNGDVYYVHHNRDAASGYNRLEITRLTPNAAGGLADAGTRFVSGQVQAALPAVAVAANGTVGVLYDTYDGMASHYPQFTVHLAQSTDHGVTWSDQAIVTFLSPARDNGRDRQRVLGDYQQMKAVGDFFYAAFPANGATVGRSISNIDPFFLKLPAAR